MGFHEHKRIISAVKRVEFVSNKMSYVILKGCSCYIIPLKVRASTEDNTDDRKDSLYEELGSIFKKFPTEHMKIFLGSFIAEVGREDRFKEATGNENLHEISNGNGIRAANFASPKI
jgi:hypothetical protein